MSPEKTSDDAVHIRTRKDEHLDLCISGDVGFHARSTLLEEVDLVHDALCGVSLDEVDLSVDLMGHRLRAPVLIAAMTGGAPRAQVINEDLAIVAEELGIGFGYGSQRAFLKYGVDLGYHVRLAAPHALLMGNLGAVQVRDCPVETLAAMLRDTGADAVCVHLNPAMELVQEGGDRDFRGCLEAIGRLVAEVGLPVMVKETGCGLSRQVGVRLQGVGVRYVDTGGAGGTSWTAVEGLRSRGANAAIAATFREWGIPTAASVVQLDGLGLEVVATGGIWNGLDAARALALGARAVGLARAVLQAHAAGGRPGARAFLERVIQEIRITLALCGCRDIASLQRTRWVAGPRLAAWLPRDVPVRRRLLD